jgi:lysophospholipase L1-like esterase
MKIQAIILLVTLIVAGCSRKVMNTNHTVTYTYLALGDSYTIGESVPYESNFPNQLSKQLSNVKSPTIIARTGWTTGELIEAINNSDIQVKKYDIVTLLIGVNNQYRGQSKDIYRTEFVQLLNTAIDFSGNNKAHVFVVSIPDWGVTPFAAGRDRPQIAAEIDAFNAINKQESDKLGVAYVNITPISKQAGTDASLNADDGLHPSAKMYGLWVGELLPAVNKQLGK